MNVQRFARELLLSFETSGALPQSTEESNDLTVLLGKGERRFKECSPTPTVLTV